MESLRLRLVFKNGGILSDTQKSQGLKKSWLLLQPQQRHLKTITELSDYIIQMFHLHQSCPHGLLLYLDGFVLPPFESISILKDEDMICLKKQGHVLSIEENDGADKIEETQIVKKQPVDNRILLLANEEFDKETGGYQSEESNDESEQEDEGNNSKETEHLEGGNAILRKRKAPESEIIQVSEHKKQRSEPPRTFENEVHPEQTENATKGVPSKKNSGTKKEKLSKREKAITIETNSKSAEKTDGNVVCTSRLKRNEQLQKTDKDIDGGIQVTEINKKVPSRSARRKKAKRRYLHEMAKIQENNLDSQQNRKPAHPKAGKKEEIGRPKGLLHSNEFGQSATPWRKNEEENQNSIVPKRPIQNGDIEDEVIPVVIRPGHIRFEPLEEDADQAAHQSQLSVEKFQWNGIVTKRKGQKWGIEKGSGSQRNGRRESGRYDTSQYDTNNKKDAHPIEKVDFDKLPPLPRVPKEGDVIAYRLLELSSSWTPEISSYQVGKVSQYKSESCKIILMPVPEYPIVFEKSNVDESSQQPDNSLYKEDGSLEIDFTSLVDVRVVRYGESDTGTAQSIPERANGSTLNNENAVSLVSPSDNEKQTDTPIPETGDGNQKKSADVSNTRNGLNVWDEISEALNAKKAELSKDKTSSRSSWSHRALKGSALGPTMAFLRSEKQEKK